MNLELFPARSRIIKLQKSLFFRALVKIKTEQGKQEEKIRKEPPFLPLSLSLSLSFSSSRRTGRGVLNGSKGQACSMKKAVERRRSNPRFSFNNSYPRTRPEYLRSWTGIFEGIRRSSWQLPRIDAAQPFNSIERSRKYPRGLQLARFYQLVRHIKVSNNFFVGNFFFRSVNFSGGEEVSI